LAPGKRWTLSAKISRTDATENEDPSIIYVYKLLYCIYILIQIIPYYYYYYCYFYLFLRIIQKCMSTSIFLLWTSPEYRV
jgi:hypothetical protein